MVVRRKGIARKSIKQATLEKVNSEARRQYKLRWMTCQWCEQNAPHDVHEILRGTGNRNLAFALPECWLALCRTCHEEFGNAEKWPIHRQAALKLLVDPDRFSSDLLNKVASRKIVDSVRLAGEILSLCFNDPNRKFALFTGYRSTTQDK
jgi:hypothetical protein